MILRHRYHVPARLLLTLLLLLSPHLFAASVSESLRFVKTSPEYVELTDSDAVALDLRYATTHNFTGKDLYGTFNRAFLHRIAAAKLERAAALLHATHPKYKLVIFDALRPRSVQYVLWNIVRGTDQQKYVADPKGGSIHNFGFAVDLSILDETGKELDMGTPFDDFTELAQPRLEARFLESGKLTGQQLGNRHLLRKAMEEAGFIPLPIEWWHFDALPKDEIKKKFSIVE